MVWRRPSCSRTSDGKARHLQPRGELQVGAQTRVDRRRTQVHAEARCVEGGPHVGGQGVELVELGRVACLEVVGALDAREHGLARARILGRGGQDGAAGGIGRAARRVALPEAPLERHARALRHRAPGVLDVRARGLRHGRVAVGCEPAHHGAQRDRSRQGLHDARELGCETPAPRAHRILDGVERAQGNAGGSAAVVPLFGPPTPSSSHQPSCSSTGVVRRR